MSLKELLAYIFTVDFLQLFENVAIYNRYIDNKKKYIDTAKLRFNAPGKTYISRVRGVFEPPQNDYTLEDIGENWVRAQLAATVMESFAYLNNTSVIKNKADEFMLDLLECCEEEAHSYIDKTAQSTSNEYCEQTIEEEEIANYIETRLEMTEGEFVGFCNKIQDEQNKPLYEIVDFGGTGTFIPTMFEFAVKSKIMTVDKITELVNPLAIFGRTRSDYENRLAENIAMVFLYHVMNDVNLNVYVQIVHLKNIYTGEIEPDYKDYGYGDALKNLQKEENNDIEEQQ